MSRITEFGDIEKFRGSGDALKKRVHVILRFDEKKRGLKGNVPPVVHTYVDVIDVAVDGGIAVAIAEARRRYQTGDAKTILLGDGKKKGVNIDARVHITVS